MSVVYSKTNIKNIMYKISILIKLHRGRCKKRMFNPNPHTTVALIIIFAKSDDMNAFNHLEL